VRRHQALKKLAKGDVIIKLDDQNVATLLIWVH
jgi:hypothetical protein